MTTNVRGVDVESGALVAGTQEGDREVDDEAAVWTALRTRTPRAVFLTGRTVQRLAVVALAASTLNGLRRLPDT